MNEHPFAFGAIERPEDPRDYQLGEVSVVESFPETFMPNISALATHHQHKLPTCGANAFAWFQQKQFGSITLSPRYSWIGFKKIDGFPLDAGTDMLSIFKSGKTDGACDDSVCPDDSTMELGVYSNPATIIPTMITNGQGRRVKTYAFQLAPTMNQIKQAIYQHGAVIILLRVGEEMWTRADGVVSWQEHDILPLRTPKTVISGHFVTLYGYDKDYIYFKNSWGSSWGRQGSGYFGENYLPYIVEIGTTVNLSNQPVFERDLTVGMSGADVIALQNYLMRQGFAISAGATGYFGAQTKSAVAAWQAHHGITPSVGYFGAKSRAFIKLN